MTEDRLELSAFYEDNRRKESGTATPVWGYTLVRVSLSCLGLVWSSDPCLVNKVTQVWQVFPFKRVLFM